MNQIKSNASRILVAWRLQYRGPEGLWIAGMFLAAAFVCARFNFVDPAPEAQQQASAIFQPFLPSISIAAGRGCVMPFGPQSPQLQQFLDRQVRSFDARQIPDSVQSAPVSGRDRQQLYLYYLVGLVWRVLGVSWDTLKVVPILFYALTAVCVYGVMRFAGGRLLSFAATLAFMMNHDLLMQYMWIRDSSKAVFIIASIWIVVILLFRTFALRRFLLLAVLAGGLVGIGVGFRRDVLILLPPLCAACVLATPNTTRVRLARCGAIILLLAVFFVASRPVLLVTNGLYVSHEVLMGFATVTDDGLNIAKADYEQIRLLNDDEIDMLRLAAARRAGGQFDPSPVSDSQAEDAGWRYVRQLLQTYPADAVVRAYATAAWALCGGERLENVSWLRKTVLVLLVPMLVLYLVGWRHGFLRGAVFFSIALWLFAYPSIHFGYRHAFHLSFAPYWGGLLVFSAIASRWTHGNARGGSHAQGIALVLVAAVSLIGLLQVARLLQERNVSTLARAYRVADRQSIPVHPRQIGTDWTLFAVDGPLDSPERYNQWGIPFCEHYLIAAFALGEAFPLYVKHTSAVEDDYTYECIMPAAGGEDAPLWYVFPVYENRYFAGDAWRRFEGLALPAVARERFLGLYRLTQPAAFALWPSQILRPGGMGARSFKRFALFGEAGSDATQYPSLPSLRRTRDRTPVHITGNEDATTAIPKLRSALAADPEDAGLWVWLGKLQEQAGDSAGAEDSYMRAIALHPDEIGGYEGLARLFPVGSDLERGAMIWRSLVVRFPQAYFPHRFLGQVLAVAAQRDEAVREYRAAIDLAPWREDTYTELAAMGGGKPPAENEAMWREIAQQHPVAGAWCGLAEAAFANGNPREAETAIAQVAAVSPGNPNLSLRCADLWAAMGKAGKARAAYLDAHRLMPENPRPVLGLANLELALGRHSEAAAWLRTAAQAGAVLSQEQAALIEKFGRK